MSKTHSTFLDTESGIEAAKRLAAVEVARVHKFALAPKNSSTIERALQIRAVETTLLELFGQGKLHGTIHTCVGQEFTGALLTQQIRPQDVVMSNHRCHGHFIGVTGNWQGLVDEIIGNADGVCAGIGSSQHLYSEGFMSNGQQGGLLPVGAGVALDRKRNGRHNIVVNFIGEGTLGEGILYETLNIASLWSLPQLFICENNFYSQSTPQLRSVAGDIASRASAFGVRSFSANTWNPQGLSEVYESAFEFVRSNLKPAFILVQTYRLNAHSKGDDDRSPEELEFFRRHDPLTTILAEYAKYRMRFAEITEQVQDYAAQAITKPKLTPAAYFKDQLPREQTTTWSAAMTHPHSLRINQQLNKFYSEFLAHDQNAFFIGEDIAGPYGGAFKIAKDLESKFSDRVLTTPISEAAITGVGIGLAVAGNRPMVEIMFGDFMTFTLDQLVNNASKFFHVYNQKICCPLIVRTPMGGRRGYGPTHSQSLERFFLGIDNCLVLAVNSIVEIETQLNGLGHIEGPTIVFENKIDYALRTFEPPPGFTVETGNAGFPTIRVRPTNARANVTIVCYGGMARYVCDRLDEIFDRSDALPEVIIPVRLHPLDSAPIAASTAQTGRLVVIEEGPSFGNVSSEIITQAVEAGVDRLQALRIAAHPVPIPSVPELEDIALPSIDRICGDLRKFLQATSL